MVEAAAGVGPGPQRHVPFRLRIGEPDLRPARAEEADRGRAHGDRHMHRAAVVGYIQPAAVDQRGQTGERTGIDDGTAVAGQGVQFIHGLPPARLRHQDDRRVQFPDQPRRQFGETPRAPGLGRPAGAGVQRDDRTCAVDSPRREPGSRPLPVFGREVHFGAIVPGRNPQGPHGVQVGVEHPGGSGPPDLDIVRPAPSPHVIADPVPCSGGQGQQRAPGIAEEIDRQVEPPVPQGTEETHLRGAPGQDGPAREQLVRQHDHFFQVGVPGEDRRGPRLRQVVQGRLRVPAFQRPDHRRRKHHVADEPQTGYEYALY